MNCRTCNYPLWNLTTGTCPECGTAFEPSDFEFRPGTVRFLCPHCQQQYFGTDERGHLVPSAFTCISCQRPISMDEMVLSPAEGLAESQTMPHELPWLQPEKRGLWRRWWVTTRLALFNPGSLMEARDDQSSLSAAWGYFLLTMAIVTAAGVVLGIVMMAVVFGLTSAGGRGGTGPFWIMLVMQAATFGIAMVVFIATVVVWTLSAHAVLRLTGPCTGTIRSTFHAMLYSGGTYVLAAIPCVNNISWIWWIVSAILMVRRAQGVSGGRATLAVLLLPVVMILAVIALYVGLFALAFAAAGSGPGSGSVVSSTSTGDTTLIVVAQAVEQRAQTVGGWDEHDHALLLVLDGFLQPSDFVSWATPTITEDVAVGATTLDVFGAADPEEQARILSQAALPAGVVAHRVGDFVFTYHGIDATDPPAGLWIVLLSPDPAAGPAPYVTLEAVVVQPDGSLVSEPIFLPPGLEAQNALRAQHGLSPLPDPATITAGNPALSDDADASP